MDYLNYYTLPHLGPTNINYLYGLPLEQKLNFRDFIFSSLKKKITKEKEIKNEKPLLIEEKKEGEGEGEIRNNIENESISPPPLTQSTAATTTVTATPVRRGRPPKKNNEVSSGTTVEEENKIT
jgi:hypothetical protein